VTIHQSVRNEILEVIIDRPKANAIDAATSRELGKVFSAFMIDPQIHVAIITGAGERFFSAGWDLGAATDGEPFDADFGNGGFGGFPELPLRNKPIIAAVNGMAVGGGFEIAMAADFIVAADSAQFFLPEAMLGIIADAATVKLPRLIPRHIATEMLLTGRRMSADEAAKWGLVNRVVPASDVMASARELAAQLCAVAPLSIAAMLELARSLEMTPSAQAMRDMRDNSAYRTAIDSRDAKEGPAAFAEKRLPQWKGK
jgi:crotonobetainyl-CoA hydratase